MLLTAAATSAVAGLMVAGGMRLLADYDEMVERTHQGTNGPIGGILVTFAGCLLFAWLAGLAAGAVAGARARGAARGLALAAIGAVAPAVATLVAVLVAIAAWPILSTSPSGGMSAPWNLAVVALVAGAAGALLGWGVASLARFVRRKDRERDLRGGSIAR